MLSHKQHVYTQFCHTKPCHTWVFSRRILSHMALSAAVFSSNLSSTVSFLVFSLLKNWHVGISRPISSWVPVLALFPAFLVVLLASRPFSLLSPSPCCPSGVCWVRLGHMFFSLGIRSLQPTKVWSRDHRDHIPAQFSPILTDGLLHCYIVGIGLFN